jgi:hypothetical protein
MMTMATTGGTQALGWAWYALYKIEPVCKVVWSLKSMQHWPNTTFKHMLSDIAEGMTSVDSPYIHSMMWRRAHLLQPPPPTHNNKGVIMLSASTYNGKREPGSDHTTDVSTGEKRVQSQWVMPQHYHTMEFLNQIFLRGLEQVSFC